MNFEHGQRPASAQNGPLLCQSEDYNPHAQVGAGIALPSDTQHHRFPSASLHWDCDEFVSPPVFSMDSSREHPRPQFLEPPAVWGKLWPQLAIEVVADEQVGFAKIVVVAASATQHRHFVGSSHLVGMAKQATQ